jgi:hypothetical protein
MTAINFPDSPSNGDTHVVGGVTYTYDSTETKWKTTINSNAFLPLTGGTVSGNIVLAGGISGGINVSGAGWGVLPYVANSLVIDNNAGEARFFATGANATTKGSFIFYNGETDGGADAAMAIDSAGNVGIGTTSPISELHIEKATQAHISVKTASSNMAKFGSKGNDVYIAGTAGATNVIFKRNVTSTDHPADSGIETARIDSSGNLKFNSGYGSAATAYGCRAWVNFNGTGTVAIRASGNVSSITDNGTGNYTVNFTTAMPDVNYCAVTDCGALTSGGTMAGNIATGSFRMLTMNGSFANEDRSIVFASVFR